MNKFLFITDLHFSASGPRSRKDNYAEALMKKLDHVFEACDKHNVEHILLGGDTFDHPSISDRIAGAVAKKFTNYYNESGVDVYAIVGNHDVYGKNSDDYDDAKLALFAQYPWFNISKDNEIFKFAYCNVCGVNYAKGLELVEGIDVDKKYKNVIVMLHSMITGEEKSVSINGNKILVSYRDMKFSKNIKLALCGHFHPGFDVKMNKGVKFSNPGSFARTSKLIARTSVGPGYSIITADIDGVKVKQYKLPCESDVFEITDEDFGEVDEVSKQMFLEALTEFKSEVFTMDQLVKAVYSMIGEDLGLDFKVDQELADFIIDEFKEKK